GPAMPPSNRRRTSPQRSTLARESPPHDRLDVPPALLGEALRPEYEALLKAAQRCSAKRCAALRSASYSGRHAGGMLARKCAAVITTPPPRPPPRPPLARAPPLPPSPLPPAPPDALPGRPHPAGPDPPPGQARACVVHRARRA